MGRNRERGETQAARQKIADQVAEGIVADTERRNRQQVIDELELASVERARRKA